MGKPSVARDASLEQPKKSVSSEQWRQVAMDPLVQSIKEAVDGTLFDIRPADGVARGAENADDASSGRTVES